MQPGAQGAVYLAAGLGRGDIAQAYDERRNANHHIVRDPHAATGPCAPQARLGLGTRLKGKRKLTTHANLLSGACLTHIGHTEVERVRRGREKASPADFRVDRCTRHPVTTIP